MSHAPRRTTAPVTLELAATAVMPCTDVLATLGSTRDGLSDSEARRRHNLFGPNQMTTLIVRWPGVLVRQFTSPLLWLLGATCITAAFLGQVLNATIILVILILSAALGFVNEYRAEQAAVSVQKRVQSMCVVTRSGQERRMPIVELVPGDVVVVEIGGVIPADVRFIAATALECNESVLTGESTPSAKSAEALTFMPRSLSDHHNCGFMGTVVTAGNATAVVVAVGRQTHLGRLAKELDTRAPHTAFQEGLQRFSQLLLAIAAILSGFVLVVNIALHRPVIDAVLFSLAIAVGITPEMLPVVVTISLSQGARRLATHKVIVKRLICIEDLGDVQVLFTDKTGTLTAGELMFEQVIDAHGESSPGLIELGLLATASAQSTTHLQAGHSALDRALWNSTTIRTPPPMNRRVIATLPFDHQRRRSSIIVTQPFASDGENPSALLLVKGAPDAVLERCDDPPASAHQLIRTHQEQGARVIALAQRHIAADAVLSAEAESHLQFCGLLIYRDIPKPDVSNAITRLNALGVLVKVITGDNPVVARWVCEEVGIVANDIMTATEVDGMCDDELAQALQRVNVFAQVSPEQKQRIVRVQRQRGTDVAFLGDGVNDALALHEADVGLSVEGATDVAQNAADVVLLEKDLHVLADGIVEGRQVFANTIKYVAMGSSSNFGNMFSAAGASAVLSFLPMLPSQILLNNLLYDASQLAISTDRVDPEQLRRPAHWDLAMIRRYMLFFGLISSMFDFATFALMLLAFDAEPSLFRSAWFIESLATQTLVIFAIRTARRPWWRSRASKSLTTAALAVVLVGAALLWSPAATWLGFQPLPGEVVAAIAGLVVVYLSLVELGKRVFSLSAAEQTSSRTAATRFNSHEAG